MRISDWSSDVCSSDLDMMDTRAGGQIVILERLLRDDERRRSAITDLRAGRRGDRAALLQNLDPGDAFERRIEADAFVDEMHFAAFGGVDFEPDDLALEMARLGRRLAAAVARKSVV